jgi:hypothetical protein
MVLDTRVYRRPEIESDHYLVIAPIPCIYKNIHCIKRKVNGKKLCIFIFSSFLYRDHYAGKNSTYCALSV